jgi:hypothetical protein
MTEQVFKGRTEDAAAPMLGAKFWAKEKVVVGVIERSFESEYGTCFVMRALKPVIVDGEEAERFCVGGMAGFKMALQAAGLMALKVGDKVWLKCTGETPSMKPDQSPRVNFEVEVTRAAGAAGF